MNTTEGTSDSLYKDEPRVTPVPGGTPKPTPTPVTPVPKQRSGSGLSTRTGSVQPTVTQEDPERLPLEELKRRYNQGMKRMEE